MEDNKEKDFEEKLAEALMDGCGITLACFLVFALIGLIISLL